MHPLRVQLRRQAQLRVPREQRLRVVCRVSRPRHRSPSRRSSRVALAKSRVRPTDIARSTHVATSPRRRLVKVVLQQLPNHLAPVFVLGLTVSRQGICAVGGELRVRNLPGNGCIFSVKLPLGGGPTEGNTVTPRRPTDPMHARGPSAAWRLRADRARRSVGPSP